MNGRAARRTFAGLTVAYALLAAPALALGVFVVSGRGSAWPIWIHCLVGAVVMLLALLVAARRHRVLAIVCALESLALCAFVSTYFAAPLPAGHGYAGALPGASPPP